MPARVEVYTRQWCGYCSAATRFLDKKGVAYTEIDCTGDHEKRKWIAQASGQSTVPQIFIDGTSIGGYSDMKALDDRGELDALLAGQASAASS